MKLTGATRYKLGTRIFLLLLIAGIISGGLYLLFSDGAEPWQFGSTFFSFMQAFNQGFARLVTGGQLAGGFGRRGLFGSYHSLAGFIGIFRNLIYIIVVTMLVIAVQKLAAFVRRIIHK